MGLDTTHGAWHGAYSAFHNWRREIARVAGYPPLELMQGFWQGNDHYTSPFWQFKKIYPTGEEIGAAMFGWVVDQFPIKWDNFQNDPLIYLLTHSDCDGDISYGLCGKIAKRLEELMPKLPDEDFKGHIGNFKEKTQSFINGLKLAHSKKRETAISLKINQ